MIVSDTRLIAKQNAIGAQEEVIFSANKLCKTVSLYKLAFKSFE